MSTKLLSGRNLISLTPDQCNRVCVPNSVCGKFKDEIEPVCACVPGYFLYYLILPNTCERKLLSLFLMLNCLFNVIFFN